jgi:hypothetical protein
MSLAKFLLKLAFGVTSLLFGVIGLGLGLGRVLFWPLTDFMDPGIIASVVGGVLLTAGVWLLLMARGDLQDPDFMRGLIVGAHKRGKWTNALCPSCLWWMKTRIYKFPRESDQPVQIWYCTNPAHENSWPEGT